MRNTLLLRTRASRSVLTALLATSWTGVLSLAAPEPAADTPLVAKLKKSFAAVDAAARETPRDTFDPQALLETVGREPQQLFDWVRTNTRAVPYEGRLRGPVGVLMDRTGNSLDRSLLLATLLQSAGFEVRLAHGAATPGVAAAPVADAPPAAAAPDTTQQIKKYADRFGLDAAAIDARLKGSEVEADRLMEDAVARVAQQTPVLAAAIGKTEAVAPAAVITHWWAEAKDGDAWTAYDVSQDAPGKSIVPAAATTALDALPAEQDHRVKLTVTIEQWDGGKFAEKKVLEQTLASADVVGVPIKLTHNPLKWNPKIDVIDSDDLEAVMRKNLSAQTEWLPVLWVGAKPAAQSSFRTDGSTNAKPQADAAGGVGNQVGGAFGGLMGGGDESTGDSGALTAEWIDYEIQTPGRPTRTVRRQIFDLVGPSARAAGVSQKPGGTDDERRLAVGLGLTGSTDILVQANQLAPLFVQQQLMSETVKKKDLFLDIAKTRGQSAPAGAGSVDMSATAGSDLLSLAMARHDWAKHKDDVYFNRTNVLTYHAFLKQNDKRQLVACEGYDIVANDLAVKPGVDPAKVRLAQGVLDTTAEALLIGGCGKVHNTSELQAAGAGDWKVLRPGDDAALKDSPLSADTKHCIARDLADGCVVLIPGKVPDGRAAGWWRYDPATGTVLGIGDNGWGASTTEYVAQGTRITLNVLDMILCTMSAISVKSEAGKAAGMLVCMAKGTLKGTKLLLSGPGKAGTGLVIDLMSDVTGALIAPGAKAIFSK